MSAPYREAAWAYWGAGWRGVLPLPARRKGPPPSGYTGWVGIEPSGADVQAWCDGPEGAGNIALRLPAGVYGLDVDAYGAKGGAAALEALEAKLGPLPATWVSSARDDGVSGIRLFRAALPAGRRWRDEPGGHGAGIEAIHFGHRYAVVAPSIHPETGLPYHWWTHDGRKLDGGTPQGLPELPAAWAEALSEPGEVASGEAAGHQQSIDAVNAMPDPGEACERMREASARAALRLRDAGDGAALHPAARDGTHELVRLGHEGHGGARRALAEHYGAFVAVRVARGGDQRAAEAEWWRLTRGAVGKLHGAQMSGCNCVLPDVGFEWSSPSAAPAGDADASEGGGEGGAGGLAQPEWKVPAELVTDVVSELHRLRVRDHATEIHQAQQHARTWTAPTDHGDLTAELAIPDTDPQWRIHGLLGMGHNAIVVAGRKTGKTTMINELVRSYADGEKFLGTQEIVPADASIAIFNYEVDERQYRRWLREVGIVNTDRVFALHLRGRTLPLRNGRVRTWVANWLRERRVGMWILDPYSRAYIGSLDNGNDEAQVSAFLDTLDVIKGEAGVSELVMPVHTPKARVESGDESAIGSQRLEGWPDVMWYLTRDGKARFIRAEGRDVEFGESQLEYDEQTRRLRVELFGQDRRGARITAGLDRLIRYVHENPECTQNMIMASLGWNAKTVAEIVNASGGRIVREPGRNRSLIHILKEDISGVTQKESHTELHRVTPGSGVWCDSPEGESPPHPVSVTDSGHVTPAEIFNPFDLDGAPND